MAAQAPQPPVVAANPLPPVAAPVAPVVANAANPVLAPPPAGQNAAPVAALLVAAPAPPAAEPAPVLRYEVTPEGHFMCKVCLGVWEATAGIRLHLERAHPIPVPRRRRGAPGP